MNAVAISSLGMAQPCAGRRRQAPQRRTRNVLLAGYDRAVTAPDRWAMTAMIREGGRTMAVARWDTVAIDCPDATALAEFYHQLLGYELVQEHASLKNPDGPDIWFQEVEGYRPPTWPTQERGQQIHFDLVVPDLETGIREAIAIGATDIPDQTTDSFHVMLDPAGHPFCLCIEE